MEGANLLADRLKKLIWADSLSNEGAKDLVKVFGVHPRHLCGPYTAKVHKLYTGLLGCTLLALIWYRYL